ncbi:MAG: hypothetical protein ACTSU5_18325 [Promethearchaeota archaeon]
MSTEFILYWTGTKFDVTSEKTAGIFLELDEENSEWIFSYTAGESLIQRRTALRRANEIAKVGYLKADGSRVGVNFKVKEETSPSSDLPDDLRKAQRDWYSR